MKKRHSHKNRKSKHTGYHCQGRIWIENNGETFLGFGRVVLLEKIHALGSISQAARSMEMSYKHAWDLIRSMNQQSKEPLVLTVKGGKGGGGATITEAGILAINQFRILQERLQIFLKQQSKELTLGLK